MHRNEGLLIRGYVNGGGRKVTPKRDSEERSSTGHDRFKEAKKSLEEMMKEIKPFVKYRKTKVNSTTGKWVNTSATEG